MRAEWPLASVVFQASLTRSALPVSFYSDTVDSDAGRSYAQFPFFPLQVAETAFLKQLFLWCEANGKILNLNGPNTSLAVLHLCHSVTSDSSGPKGHWSLADRLVTMAAGKRHLLLPSCLTPAGNVADLPSTDWLHHANCSLFFGEVPCPWYAYQGASPKPPPSKTWPTDWQVIC